MINHLMGQYVPMFLGAALDHELPLCNGKGRCSTIRVEQYKSKFSEIRIYCKLADSGRVLELWERDQYETRVKSDGSSWSYEELRKKCLFNDAVHYRSCYMAMLALLTNEDDKRNVRNGADYRELLCEDELQMNLFLQKDIDKAPQFPQYFEHYRDVYDVQNFDELKIYLLKVMNYSRLRKIMTNLAWATDIHLDFIDSRDQKALVQFGESLVESNPSAILLTGDISVAKSLTFHLSALERIVERPVYFVLGNHDFYHGSVAEIRKNMKELTNMSQYLRYLPTTPYVSLSPKTALIGHDGWYDAGYGDVKKTNFVMRDWTAISEFVMGGAMSAGALYGNESPNYGRVIVEARKLAHEATLHVMNGIKAAAKYHNVMIIATHFPPFQEAHIHEGRIGDAGARPWYTSKMMGDMLRQAAISFPKVRFEVFAGHTHGQYSGQIADNLFCHVGGAEYHKPRLQSLIEVP